MRLLFVEDDTKIGTFVVNGLKQAGFAVDHAKDGEEGLGLTVYFPDKKVLFGGCAVKSAQTKNLGFTGDAVMSQWPVSLNKILERYKDAAVVVPGHGEAGGVELIRHTLSLF